MEPCSNYARVVRLAVRHSNAIGARQIRELGISKHWIQHNVRSGLLTPVESGVYVVGLDIGDLPWDTCAMVGVLRCRGSGSLSFETAAALHGIWSRGPDDVHVSTTSRSSDVVTGLATDLTLFTHRVRALAPPDVVRVREFPVTSVLRTIFDLGRVLTPLQLAHVIWNALYAEQITLTLIRRRLASSSHHRGVRVVRAAVALIESGSCGTKSRSEDEFVSIAVRFGHPTPLVNVLDVAGLPGVRLDFVWPERRVVIELDGRHHSMPGIKASDQSVVRALRQAGWTVRRVHYSRVWNDPIGIVRMLDSLVGAR